MGRRAKWVCKPVGATSVAARVGNYANPLAHHPIAAQCVLPITEPFLSILVVRSGCAYDHSLDTFQLDGFWRELSHGVTGVSPQPCFSVCATKVAVSGVDAPIFQKLKVESCARACSRPPRPVWSSSMFQDLGMVASAGASPTWMIGRRLWEARVLSTVGKYNECQTVSNVLLNSVT